MDGHRIADCEKQSYVFAYRPLESRTRTQVYAVSGAKKKNKLKRNAPTHSHTHTLAVSWAHCIVHSSEWSISPFCLNHLAMFGAALLCVTIAALAETVTKYDITLVVACTRSAVASLERVIAEQLWCGRSLLKGLC